MRHQTYANLRRSSLPRLDITSPVTYIVWRVWLATSACLNNTLHMELAKSHGDRNAMSRIRALKLLEKTSLGPMYRAIP